MGRLTLETREKMAVALVRHAYVKKAVAMHERRAALFMRVYQLMYSADVRALMDKLLELNPGAFPESCDLTVNAGMIVILNTAHDIAPYMRGVDGLGAVTRVPLLATDLKWNTRIDIPDGYWGDPKLHNDIRAFANETETLRAEVLTAYKEARATLDGFNTIKRLREGWPEAMPIIGHLIPAPERGGLPAVQIEAINAKFGLPPEEAA